MDPRLHAFEAEIVRHWPLTEWQEVPLLIAVSGGPDSVALFRAMHQLASNRQHSTPVELHVAHFNHGWRAEASVDHERFVTELAAQFEVPVHVQRSERPEMKEAAA